jgi:lantibiotic modifying enzyme
MIALQFREEESLRSDLNHAVAAMQADSFASQDGLCCGNLGIADILLTVGRGLNREDLLDDAHKRAARVFRMATGHGGFRLFDGITGNAATPGLFQGLTGAAYAAIRLSGLGSPPNVLSFE